MSTWWATVLQLVTTSWRKLVSWIKQQQQHTHSDNEWLLYVEFIGTGKTVLRVRESESYSCRATYKIMVQVERHTHTYDVCWNGKCEMWNVNERNDVVVHVFYRVIKICRGLCVRIARYRQWIERDSFSLTLPRPLTYSGFIIIILKEIYFAVK